MGKHMIELDIKTELADSRSNLGLISLLVVLGYLDSVHDYRVIRKKDLGDDMTKLYIKKRVNYYDEEIPSDS